MKRDGDKDWDSHAFQSTDHDLNWGKDISFIGLTFVVELIFGKHAYLDYYVHSSMN